MSNLREELAQKSIVYSGDKIIQKVLEKLGVLGEIAKNPYVIEKVSIMVCEFMLQSGITIKGIKLNGNRLEGECTEDSIKAIVNSLPVDTIRHSEPKDYIQLGNVREEEELEPKAEATEGTTYIIVVDSETQRFYIKKEIKVPGKKQEMITETFGYDKTTGNVIESISSRKTYVINIVNPNGIVMKRRWNEQGEKIAEMVRMEDNPLITKVEYNGETIYYPMRIDELASMMGNTMEFCREQLNTEEMKNRGDTSFERALVSEQYITTKAGIEENGVERGNRFSKGLEEICKDANISVPTR